jgi:hypothetical protein
VKFFLDKKVGVHYNGASNAFVDNLYLPFFSVESKSSFLTLLFRMKNLCITLTNFQCDPVKTFKFNNLHF